LTPAILFALLFTTGCVHISDDDAFDRYDPDGDGVPWPQDCAPYDETASHTETWYADTDSDGAGDPDAPQEACGAPEGYVGNDHDCDDTRGDIYPGATDDCDGVDNDCDLQVDEDAGGPRRTWYADADADTYGDPDQTTDACVQPEGYVDNHDDCDDDAASVHPSATEVCNGIDDDCNDYVDDEDPFVVAPIWYADFDTDGFGALYFTTEACEQPTGFVDNDDDCNDIDPATHPGAPETDCEDPTDYNCDGSVGYADVDGDGFAACEECNDAVGAINPDADEVCDGIDNDCDGTADVEAVDADLFFADSDDDGYGDAEVSVLACQAPSGFVSDDTDCDDTASWVNPGVVEVCDPLDVDEDCNGVSDAADPASTGLITWYGDDDGDGYGEDTDTFDACEPVGGFVAEGGDCDDEDEDTYPGAPELCDGIDNDCDQVADDGTPVTWYADTDGDLYGDPNDHTAACFRPDGYVFDASDCDDSRGDVHPDAPEMCDGVDNDCDNDVDEDNAVDAATWYFDGDDDGFGVTSDTLVMCDQPTDYVADPGDCDDADPDRNPGEAEVCDPSNVDEDCNGLADDADPGVSNRTAWHWDLDGDTYGDETRTTWSCDQPPLHVLDGTDCNDGATAIHPGAVEIPDDHIDQDCTGVDAVTCFVDWDQDTFGTDLGTTTVAADGSCDTADQESDDDTDCDDTNPDAYPGAIEIPLDGVDQDCDGSDAGTCPLDGDGDGYGHPTETVDSADEDCDDEGEAWTADDCDDSDEDRNPGEEEIVDDGIDQDCNGFDTITCVVDADHDAYGTDLGTTTLAPDGSCDTADGESEDDTDCDDTDPDSHPLAPEVPDDGIDQDCNDHDTVTCIVDGDTDGFGTIEGTTTLADDGTCDQLQGESDEATDCDDLVDTVYPGAPETPDDEIDQDCNGSDTVTCIVDADFDGFGTDVGTETLAEDGTCDAAEGESDEATDCDDADAGVNPGGTETAGNEVDEDCDDTILCYVDADEDGYGDISGITVLDDVDLLCLTDDQQSNDASDCNDTNPDVNPGVGNCQTNTPPDAWFDVDPVTAEVGEAFTVDASLSDDVQTPVASLQVRWDWDNDGQWDTAFSTTKVREQSYPTPGVREIALEVRDGGGLSDFFVRAVNVAATGATLVVDTNTDDADPEVYGGPYVNGLSLREAVTLSNATPGADTITFASAMTIAPVTACFLDDPDGTRIVGIPGVIVSGVYNTTVGGLVLRSDGNVVMGLEMTNFATRAVYVDSGVGSQVRDCEFHDNTEALQVDAPGNVIGPGNYFHDNSGNPQVDIVGTCLVTGNEVSWGQGAGIRLQRSALASTVTLNLVHHNGGAGLSVSGNNSNPDDHLIGDNTIAYNDDSGILFAGGGHDGIALLGNILAFNGAWGVDAADVDLAAGSPDFNDYFGNVSGYCSACTPGTDDLTADPLFVDGPAEDFQLDPASPCIDAGTDATGLDKNGPGPGDFNGDWFDIGALEAP